MNDKVYYEITVYNDPLKLEDSMHMPIRYNRKIHSIQFKKFDIDRWHYVRNIVSNKDIFSLFSMHIFIVNFIKDRMHLETERIYLPPNFLMEVYNDWDIESLRFRHQEMQDQHPDASVNYMTDLICEYIV